MMTHKRKWHRWALNHTCLSLKDLEMELLVFCKCDLYKTLKRAFQQKRSPYEKQSGNGI